MVLSNVSQPKYGWTEVVPNGSLVCSESCDFAWVWHAKSKAAEKHAHCADLYHCVSVLETKKIKPWSLYQYNRESGVTCFAWGVEGGHNFGCHTCGRFSRRRQCNIESVLTD